MLLESGPLEILNLVDLTVPSGRWLVLFTAYDTNRISLLREATVSVPVTKKFSS